MSNKQETVADIAAEMRLGVKDWKGERLGVFDCFANRIEAAHQREVAELERKVAELRECLRMAVVNARIARTCYAFGRECDNCSQYCNARKWNKVIEATKGAEGQLPRH